jgi:signal transduction histidine kinase/CheY-like chemotaxis protein
VKRPTTPDPEECFLILAPTGRDAQLTCDLLRKAGVGARVCADIDALCSRVSSEGALGLMVAEEALVPPAFTRLRELLAQQPTWSDLPILLFSGRLMGQTQGLPLGLIETLGNVTVLDRPLRPVTMLSAANAALRARKRQYMARGELYVQQQAIKQRDQFLAMLGHELRNPLAAIAMAVDLDAEGGEHYRNIVRRQARHLTRLVDDLLDVSRVTSGKIVLQRTPVDVADLVRRSAHTLGGQIASQQLSLSLSLPTEPVVVLGDSVRLEQIVANLLHNAIKYTPAGGHVRLNVSSSEKRVTISVHDDGVGIASDMLPRVFDLFAQAEATLDRAKGGMGIGLTLVKRLVELHDGEVAVRSAGLGLGSTFTLELPRVYATDASPSLRPSPTLAAHASRKVLVVEDNDDSRELLTAMLRRAGHRVSDAADGLRGVDAALHGKPEVMFVDLGLPGLDGYGVARRVRRALGSRVLLVALTGYGQPEDRARSLDAGFDVHLTKPVDFAQLSRLLTDRRQHLS